MRATSPPASSATATAYVISGRKWFTSGALSPRCDGKLGRDLGAVHLPTPLRRGPGAADGYRIRERRTRARSPRDWSARRSEADSPQGRLADPGRTVAANGCCSGRRADDHAITNSLQADSLQAERGGQLGKR